MKNVCQVVPGLFCQDKVFLYQDGDEKENNMEKTTMNRVTVQVQGYDLDFDSAQQMARVLAERDNEMTSLVSWNDGQRNIHSPQCLQCEIKGEPGWEVYGRNHEGRLRISFNNDLFVFIFT